MERSTSKQETDCEHCEKTDLIIKFYDSEKSNIFSSACTNRANTSLVGRFF